MYAPFFGLNQEPFSIAPDPRYLFMSDRHREALAHLLYGVRSGGGFVLLSGEIGAGKTTVCRCFLEQVPKRCNVAYIFNPKLTVRELLKSVCDEFRVPHPHEGGTLASLKDYVDALNAYLLRTHAIGQNNVLIIDEAQNLSAEVLEQLRLLTNLETNERKLLQIILIGQPELRTMLARPELEQLAQRVIARFHLEALSEAETRQYIRHRLSVAGLTRPLPFDRPALQRIHQLSRGVPRRVNLLCDRALLGAYSSGQVRVNRETVDKAAQEVFDTPLPWWSASRWRAPRRRWALAGAGAALVALLAVVAWRVQAPGTPAPVAAASGVVAPPASPSAPLDAAAPAAQAAADLKRLLAAAARSEREAWRELAPAWKLAAIDGDPCAAAQRQQVRCWRSSGSTLTQIRDLDRPGILTLQGDDDAPAYVQLVGAGEHTATLSAGGQTVELPLAVLARVWRGDFATFWREPPGYRDVLADGSSGPGVTWLAQQLATVSGQPAPRKPRFDDALRAELAAFQRAQGLKGDGIAGPATYMQLNRAAGVDEPRLQARP